MVKMVRLGRFRAWVFDARCWMFFLTRIIEINVIQSEKQRSEESFVETTV